MKKCGNKHCGLVDDGEAPIRVKDGILDFGWGADATIISGPLCEICKHKLTEILKAYFPESKVKHLQKSNPPVKAVEEVK